MSPAHQYKKIENEIVDSLGKRLRLYWQGFLSFFKKVHQKGKQRFTVMFIPHSEKRIFNFQISVFTLIFIVFLLSVVLVGFIGMTTHFTTTNDQFLKVSNSLNASEASLESFKDEIVELRRVVKDFKGRMEGVLTEIGTDGAKNYLEQGVGGDLSSLVSLEDVEYGNLRDLSDLISLRTYLENAIEPLGEIHQVLEAQRDLLVDIPTLWPLKGVHGNITLRFGPAKHPFTGGWYLHKGIDIAWLWGSHCSHRKRQGSESGQRSHGLGLVRRVAPQLWISYPLRAHGQTHRAKRAGGSAGADHRLYGQLRTLNRASSAL